ncbi:MAG: hypothetical protein H6565_03705 [Lewinellaceae bacterium]|nr:hypothetical protein [Lewinellaceae bacterium]
MEIAFGIAVVLILVIGLVNRRKQKRAWVQEERYDESGNWIDKRSGERGTYGSLDAEREQERASLSRQGKIAELADLIRAFAAANAIASHEGSDTQKREFNTATRRHAAEMIEMIESLLAGKEPASPVTTGQDGALASALKKQALDFSYARFPALLDLDLEQIRKYDALTGAWAAKVCSELQQG